MQLQRLVKLRPPVVPRLLRLRLVQLQRLVEPRRPVGPHLLRQRLVHPLPQRPRPRQPHPLPAARPTPESADPRIQTRESMGLCKAGSAALDGADHSNHVVAAGPQGLGLTVKRLAHVDERRGDAGVPRRRGD